MNELDSKVTKISKENEDRSEKYDRSENKFKKILQKVKFNPDSDLGMYLRLEEESAKNKFLKNAITMLCTELPEMQLALNNNLQEMGIDINNKTIVDKG